MVEGSPNHLLAELDYFFAEALFAAVLRAAGFLAAAFFAGLLFTAAFFTVVFFFAVVAFFIKTPFLGSRFFGHNFIGLAPFKRGERLIANYIFRTYQTITLYERKILANSHQKRKKLADFFACTFVTIAKHALKTCFKACFFICSKKISLQKKMKKNSGEM